MARQASGSPEKHKAGRGAVWSSKVLSEYKLALPAPVVERVGWLKRMPNKVECYLEILPSKPALRLVPVRMAVDPLADEIARIFKTRPATVKEADQSWMDLQRFRASRWLVNPWRYNKQYRFSIPEPLRNMDAYVPDVGCQILFFAFGNTVELWRPQAWQSNVAQVQPLTDQRIEELVAEMADREQS